MPTIDRQIAATADDAYQYRDGEVYNWFDAIGLSYADEWAGFRFTGISIPSGATVGANSYMSVYLGDIFLGHKDCDIYCEENATPAQFSGVTNNISDRSMTGVSVLWDAANDYSADWYDSPSLEPIIQEVVDDLGGIGDALVFIFDHRSSDDMEITDYTGSTSLCAKLHIEYSVVAAYYHGLKVQGVGELALCDAGTHPLRIRKSGTTYGIELVDTSEPSASAVRIKTSSGIKAIRKYT